MRRGRVLPVLLPMLLMGAAWAADKPFDSHRDPAKDLAAAEARARQEHKNVLVDVGGNWCPWCMVLEGQFHSGSNERLLIQNFVVVHVNVGMFFGHNTKFLQQFPPVKSWPHLFVLGPEGQVLKEEDMSGLSPVDKKAKEYDEQKIHDFLVRWGPVS